MNRMMNSSMRNGVFFVILCAFVSGCGQEAPIKIERSCNHPHGCKMIHITSLVDSIVIKDVRGNRGQCTQFSEMNPRLSRYNNFPFKLGFGNTREVRLMCPGNDDDVIEVAIATDQGAWEFTFE